MVESATSSHGTMHVSGHSPGRVGRVRESVVSTNYIILIPTDPYYVPEPAAQKAAFAVFESLVPEADEVQLALKEEVQFFDAGENWSGAFCPACGTELSRFRWERLRRRSVGGRSVDASLYPATSPAGHAQSRGGVWPSGLLCILIASASIFLASS